MYKYLDMLNISIFLVSLYIICSSLFEKNNKNIKFEFISLTTIILFKFIFVISYLKDKDITFYKSIVDLIVLILVISIDLNKYQKKEKNIIWINYILSVCVIGVHIVLKNEFLSIAIQTYVLIYTIYLLSLNIPKGKINIKYLFQFIYVGGIFINLILLRNELIININAVLCFISANYILMKNFNLFIKGYRNKNLNIQSKINRSKINMKIHSEKLDNRKRINYEINEVIKNKEDLIYRNLLNSKKCMFIIDDENYIINEDQSFYSIWEEYEKYNYNISIDEFCENSLGDYELFRNELKSARKFEKIVEIEINDKKGRVFKCRYTPVNLSNDVSGIMCIITDITSTKKIESKIEDNDSKYRKIVDNIPYSVLISDEKEILYNNNKSEYINFEKEDIKNILLGDCIQGEFYYTYENGMDACLNIDKIKYLENNSQRTLFVIRNITNFKTLLKNLEDSKKRYESLVNIIPEGIYVVNFESKMLQYANKAFLNMMGTNCIYDIDIEDINKDIIVTSGNTNDNVKYKRTRLTNKFGQEIDIECGGMLLNINKNINMIGIVRDITEQVKTEKMEKEIEEKEKLNKSKNEFFINMSHELKTPVNLIHSSNQLVEVVYKYELEKNKNAELLESINTVKKHVNILMTLVDNIIELAKIQSDFHEMNKDYYNIVDISEDIITEFSKCIEENIEIVFDTDEEEKIANVDPNDIEKVILILLSRVVRYSLKNSNISFDIGSKNDYITMTIKNNGGYDSGKYTNDGERKVMDMGITLAKMIIELYDGKMYIKTNEEDSIEITAQIKANYEIKIYKNRSKSKQSDFVHSEYKKICDF